MSVNITFDTAENCANFASVANITIESGAISVTVPWGKLTMAKLSPGAVSFEKNILVRSDGTTNTASEFIMKGDPAKAEVAELVTVKADLGNGFYHIETEDGVMLYDLVEGLDPLEVDNLTFHSTASITDVEDNVTVIDPLSTDGQWARIRIASSYRPLLSSFTYYDSIVNKSTPEVYIIDSGINWGHPEFVNVQHEDFWKASKFADYGDTLGHGTSVASAVAGENVGIARNIKLFSAKITDKDTGFCTVLEIGQCIDAIIAKAIANPNVTRIVNASWATDKNTYLEAKFQALLDAGVTVIAASGNSGTDVALLTPAGMSQVLTVGAIDRYDIPAGFNNIAPSDSGLTTNYGQRLDMFAPGDNVALASINGGYVVKSGTSFAAAYVTGAAAEMASLFAAAVPNPILMNKMIDVSTTDALLLDDDRFSANENRIVHLVGAKDMQATKLDLYLGAVTPTNDHINIDVNTTVDVSNHLVLIPEESFTWSVIFEDPETESKYSSYVIIDPVTGILSVSTPDVALPAGEVIYMVRFKTIATSPSIAIESPWMFFFQVDPNADSLSTENDITRALSETNSTSIFLLQNILK